MVATISSDSPAFFRFASRALYQRRFAIVVVLCLVSLLYSFREAEQYFYKQSSKYHATPTICVKTDDPKKSVNLDRGLVEMTGLVRGFNVHEWSGLCTREVKNLCDHPFYPNAANKRYFTNKSEFVLPTRESGQRIFGLVHPPVTGEYIFQLMTNGEVEVWLGQNELKENFNSSILLLNHSKRTENGHPNNAQIFLNSDENYFLEILHVAGDNLKGNYLRLQWQRPNSQGFELVDHRSTSVFGDDSTFHNHRSWDERIPLGPACSRWREKGENSFLRFDKKNHDYLPHDQVREALPECDYQPSYREIRKLRKYEAVYSSRKGHIYQAILTQHPNITEKAEHLHQLDGEEVKLVVELYMKAITLRYPSKFVLNSILNVEKKPDKQKGDRYLVELEVFVQGLEKPLILSEYIFRPIAANSLCYPKGLQWDRNSTLYFIVTVKNQGTWIQHFLKNMASIVKQTQDSHVRVVVFDYNSTDINIRHALERSRLPHQLVTADGLYSRSESFNAAVKVIHDPNAIIVLLDLHLDVGSGYLYEIRKRTIEGHLTYVPVIVRLSCGASSLRPRGFWEHLGYGLVSMYRSDWDRIGGFEERENKNRWGGEDWELMDRVMGGGLELERLKCPFVYHNKHPMLAWRKSK